MMEIKVSVMTRASALMSDGLLLAARSDRARTLTTAVPLTRKVVDRFVAGEDDATAMRAATELIGAGLSVSMDRLGEDVTERAEAEATVAGYLTMLAAMASNNWGRQAEVSVKLSAIGQGLGMDGPEISLDNARRICLAAADAGATVNIDMEDHSTTDLTLDAVCALRADFADVGTVLQSMLRRTEGDCRDLARAGSRIRLVKGAYKEPASVAFTDKADVDRSYERCLKILFDGAGYPMVASHDPAMISHALGLISGAGRDADSYEFQMLYGIRADEQLRLNAAGHTMRIYVPYGTDWYGYFMRRLAERPANVGFFLRALVGK
jgi:proline dehydrogenase